jgi:hypothetical protein
MAKTSQLQIRVSPAQKAALRRRAREAGMDVSSYVLARAMPREDARLAAILGALDGPGYRFGLAELSDLLASLSPVAFGSLPAIPSGRWQTWLANYVAAMFEQTAERLGVPPPGWTRMVPPLDEPWFAADLPGLRPYLLAVSPLVFKRRNLYVDPADGRV